MRELRCDSRGRCVRATQRWLWALFGLSGIWCSAAAADPFVADALARIKSQDALGTGGISAGYDGFASGVGGTGRAAVHGNVLIIGAPFDDSATSTW